MIIEFINEKTQNVETVNINGAYTTTALENIFENCKSILQDIENLNTDDYLLNQEEIDYIQENFDDCITVENILELASWLYSVSYDYNFEADMTFYY